MTVMLAGIWNTPPPHKLAELIDDGGVVFGAPVEGRIHHAPVEGLEAIGPVLSRLDLAVDHARERRLPRRHTAQRLPHRRDLVGARRLRDLGAEPDDQFHLGPEAHIGLMIAVAMPRCPDINLTGEDRVVHDEHFFPRDFHAIAHHQNVGLIEPPGKRAVELVFGIQRDRLAHPKGEAFDVARDGAGDGLLDLVGRQRQQIADPNFVAEDGTGGQHFHAGDDDTFVILVHHHQSRNRQILLFVELGITRRLRRQHRVAGENIVVAHMLVIGRHVGAEFILVGVEDLRCRCHAGDEGRHVVGRTSDHAMGHVGDLFVRPHASPQIVSGLCLQEPHGIALATVFVGQHVLKFGIMFDVVERADGFGGAGEGGMTGHVLDAFVADIDDATVFETFEMLLAGLQHGAVSLGYSSSAS